MEFIFKVIDWYLVKLIFARIFVEACSQICLFYIRFKNSQIVIYEYNKIQSTHLKLSEKKMQNLPQ